MGGNGEGFASTAAGHRLTLGVDANESVIVVGREADPDGAKIVQDWLRACAAHVLEARRHKARKGKVTLGGFEELGQLPASVEGLIAYIGFDR